MAETNEPVIRCPKCKSTQLTSNKKGFSGKKAVAGAVLTGGIGLLAGTLGSNKVKITCLACGHTFKPGQGLIEQDSQFQRSAPGGGCIVVIMIAAIISLAIYLL